MQITRNYSQSRLGDYHMWYIAGGSKESSLTPQGKLRSRMEYYRGQQKEIVEKEMIIKNSGKKFIFSSASKKSCMHKPDELPRRSTSTIVKRVKFSPELDVSHKSKLTASYILRQIQQENKILPELISSKKLYHKLDTKFGFEGCNDYYLRYFVSPAEKFVKRHRLNPLLKRVSQLNNQIINNYLRN